MDKPEEITFSAQTEKPWLGALVFLFLIGCMVTGFYTMVIYAVGMVTGWQRIICQ